MLKCARESGLVPKFERKLAKYGLSEGQLRLAQLQNVTAPACIGFQPYTHDKQLDRHWRTCAQRYARLAGHELSATHGGVQRVPVRVYEMEVPDWAGDDAKCRAVLLAMYPTLNRTSGNAYLRKCYKGTRRRAAHTWFCMYYGWRLGYTHVEAAALAGVQAGSVRATLKRVRHKAEALFNASPVPTGPAA